MYLWNKKELLNDLKVGLSEREDMKYLLFSFIVYTLMSVIIPYENTYDYISLLIMLVYIVLSVMYLFKINEGGNFVSKYLSISCVLFFRSFVFLLIPLTIVYIFIALLIYGENMPLETTPFDIGFMLVCYAAIFYLYRKYFLELNALQK